jgi:hypothetical protein
MASASDVGMQTMGTEGNEPSNRFRGPVLHRRAKDKDVGLINGNRIKED